MQLRTKKAADHKGNVPEMFKDMPLEMAMGLATIFTAKAQNKDYLDGQPPRTQEGLPGGGGGGVNQTWDQVTLMTAYTDIAGNWVLRNGNAGLWNLTGSPNGLMNTNYGGTTSAEGNNLRYLMKTGTCYLQFKPRQDSGYLDA